MDTNLLLLMAAMTCIGASIVCITCVHVCLKIYSELMKYKVLDPHHRGQDSDGMKTYQRTL